MTATKLCVLLASLLLPYLIGAIEKDDILVYTVATEYTDGFQRYLHTAKEFGITPRVLAMGERWKGGDNMRLEAGGGWKVNLLRQELEKHRGDGDKIILFTDGYDVVFLSDLDSIYDKFQESGARVLFGAESACWPDKSLADKYPEVSAGKRYLNSGLYIAYVKELLELLQYAPIGDADDDQLFFTKAYLDEELREKLKFKLDHKSEIFQNLNGAISEIQVEAIETGEKEQETTIYNVKNFLTQTTPLILHGNGPSKLHLNAFANYVSRAWSPQDGCRHCELENIDVDKMADDDLPTVFLALFIESPTPFLLEQLRKVQNLVYPKKKQHLFIHNNAKYHNKLVQEFSDKHKDEYLSFKQIMPDDGINEWSARDLSLDQCLMRKCDYYFSVDSIAHLDNPFTLKLLLQQNRTMVGPMLTRPGKAWSNFWGALTTNGFYARSNDYLDLVHNERRGLWNVPFLANCYLLKGSLLEKHDRTKIHFSRKDLDADMSFCANLRDLDVFMHVSNRLDFGHLVNPETFDTTMAAPDMYQIFENQEDWAKRYIHPDWAESLNPDRKPLQPCPDVYWFPIVTRDFTNDLIYMMESFGKWSDGSNSDARLEGGYEAVPTRDIHMNQVGWERHWLYFMQQYVRPLQEHVFTGYFHDPPRSLMNFVVRYRPDEQPLLRPHHDSSTYTINIALNQRGDDYEGGGCRFIRYNCSVVDTKPGWLLMHPGRLTHYHEGLRVTKGTRYIMISFVDP